MTPKLSLVVKILYVLMLVSIGILAYVLYAVVTHKDDKTTKWLMISASSILLLGLIIAWFDEK